MLTKVGDGVCASCSVLCGEAKASKDGQAAVLDLLQPRTSMVRVYA